jgi:DNA polymerase-3 subunit gamma/tau
MERFIVSARKYRPVTFDTVVGQPHITQTLKNAIRNNHLAQAFLFTGPRGVGKTTTARILAKTINCSNLSPELEACNQCDSCKAFNDGHSLNIYELDAASNNSVDDIRALVEQVRYAPQMGNYKIYIIDEVHMLSPSAFNAFLKTLEEPPSYAVFILATTEKHKIIPTILSRCQIFDFNRISVDDIARHLQGIAVKEGVEAEEDALHVIAQKADGALRDALSMFDQLVSFAGNRLSYKAVIENLNILDYDYYFRITDDVLAGHTAQVLLAFDEVLASGFDGHHFLSGLAAHFRDLLVCKDEETLRLLEVIPSVREKYKLQARRCSAEWLLQQLDQCNQSDLQYKSTRNQRLLVELLLLKLCLQHMTPATPATGRPAAAPAVTTTASTPAAAPTTPAPAASAPKAQPAATAPPPAASTTPPPAATPPPAPAQRATGSGSRRTVSISGSPPPDPEKKNDVGDPNAPADPSLPRQPFSQVQLEKAWMQYAQGLASDRPAMHAALTKRKPEVKEGSVLLFTVDSSAIEKDLQELKIDLLTSLRKQLSNFSIQLHTAIQVNANPTEVPYTPTEKYQKLASKNPLLHELRKRLDLETEY